MVQSMAIVIRDNHEIEIDIAEVVPGDIVVLAAGSIIPADIRIISAKDFFVNQSAMTGESMPVEKFPAPLAAVYRAARTTQRLFSGEHGGERCSTRHRGVERRPHHSWGNLA